MEKILDFAQCPNCESTKHVANEVLQEQIEKGRMPKDSKAFLFQHQSIIAKSMQWLSAPIILSFYDVCADCGTVYCIHAEVQTAIQGGKNMPGGGFSTS